MRLALMDCTQSHNPLTGPGHYPQGPLLRCPDLNFGGSIMADCQLAGSSGSQTCMNCCSLEVAGSGQVCLLGWTLQLPYVDLAAHLVLRARQVPVACHPLSLRSNRSHATGGPFCKVHDPCCVSSVWIETNLRRGSPSLKPTDSVNRPECTVGSMIGISSSRSGTSSFHVAYRICMRRT